METNNTTTTMNNLLTPEEKISSGLALISKYRNAIMGFSALWILYFHVIIPLSLPENGIFYWIESRIKYFGYSSVDIFFLVSGLGLTYAIDKSTLAVFYYRRIKRLLLPFITVAFLQMLTEHQSLKWFFEAITGKAFFTTSLFTFLWFIPAIFILYLLFPIYWYGFKKTGAFFWTTLMLLFWFLIVLVFRDNIRSDLFVFINRIPIFMIGILLGHLTKTSSDTPFNRKSWLLIFVIFVLGIYLLELSNFKDYYILVPLSKCFLPPLLVAVSLPFLLAKGLNELECHRHTCIIGKMLNSFLKFFSIFSIELYCLQEWLYSLQLEFMFSSGLSIGVINLIYFIEMTVIAHLTSQLFGFIWFLIELPFKRMSK